MTVSQPPSAPTRALPLTDGSRNDTAQIPVISARAGYGVLLPDGTIWYPGSRRRLPAPHWVRASVVGIAIFALLCVAGYAVERSDPSLFSALRHFVDRPVPKPDTTPPATKTTTAPAVHNSSPGGTQATVASWRLVSGPPVGCVKNCHATYQVPSAAYTIVIKTGAARVWTVVDSPPFHHLIFKVLPAHARRSVAVHGRSQAAVSALGATIAVKVNGRVVGRISDPSITTTYVFRPAST